MGLEGEGSEGRGGGKWGERGREVGYNGEGSGDWVPPVHPLSVDPDQLASSHWPSSHYAVTYVLNKNSNIQGRSTYVISDFPYHKELL